MAAFEFMEKTLEAVVAINAAVRNIRLYPAGSAMVQTSIERVLPLLNAVLDQVGALAFAESEKKLLIAGELLGEKELQKPQIWAFLALLLDFNIHSLTFQIGLQADELQTFLSILSRKPDDVEKEGGIGAVVARTEIPHIFLDQKVYVPLDKDQQVVSKEAVVGVPEPGDGKASGDGPGESILDLLQDPERLTAVIDTGIAALSDPARRGPDGKPVQSLSESLRMLESMASEEERKTLSKTIANRLVDLDDDVLVKVITQELDSDLGQGVLDELIGMMGDDRFGRVTAGVKNKRDSGSGEGAGPGSGPGLGPGKGPGSGGSGDAGEGFGPGPGGAGPGLGPGLGPGKGPGSGGSGDAGEGFGPGPGGAGSGLGPGLGPGKGPGAGGGAGAGQGFGPGPGGKGPGAGSGPGPGSGAGSETIHSRYMETDPGRRMAERIGALAAEEKKRQDRHYHDALNRLIKGDPTPLGDTRVVAGLSDTISQLTEKNKPKTVDALIDRLTEGLTNGDDAVRSGAGSALADIGSQWAGVASPMPAMDRVTGGLSDWVQKEAVQVPAMEDIYAKIRRLIQSLMRQGHFSVALRFLEPLYRIGSGEVPRDPAIRALCKTVIDGVAEADILERLIECVGGAGEAAKADPVRCLQILVDAAAPFMLDILRDAEDRQVRARILRVYPELGPSGAAELTNRIEEGGPWYFLRNLVAMLGRVGGPEHLEVLVPLLQHDEMRIRRETVGSIFLIGEDRRGEILAEFLPEADDETKVIVIAMLGKIRHRPAVNRLVALLDPRAAVSAKFRDTILERVCKALELIADPAAEAPLNRFLSQRGLLRRSYSPKVQAAATRALTAVQKVMANGRPVPEAPTKTVAPKAATPKGPPPASPPAPPTDASAGDVESRIRALAESGDADAAIGRIMEEIQTAVDKRDFNRAEALREMIFSIDDMALTEIVKSAELIEEAKTAAVDRSHVEMWPDLYRVLSPDEVNALFFSMEESRFDINQTVMNQGWIDDRLLFIRDGRLKSIYRQGGRETLVRTLEPGAVAGIDSFFNITVCTTSLVALSRVRAHVLHRSALADWKDKQPALERKLMDYCLTLEQDSRHIQEQGLNRREHKRAAIRGKILVQIVSVVGSPVGKPFKGDLSDISIGGLSFFIKTAKAETARLMLGRRLRMVFGLPGPDAPIKMDTPGMVISVNYHLQNDYSIHVRFDRPLDAGASSAVDRLTRDTE